MFLSHAYAQNATDKESAATPTSIVYDLGTVVKDKEISRIFKRYNNSSEPIRIKSICTPVVSGLAAGQLNAKLNLRNE
jgi:hypothetical protein